ncbi:hypothetical protein C8J57DRAFT_1583151, partial [Mycena rebaudengoi]
LRQVAHVCAGEEVPRGCLRAGRAQLYTVLLILSRSHRYPAHDLFIFVFLQYYYERSWWSGKYAYADNVRWEEKIAKIYWRGMSNGGMIMGDNFRHFARFRLADLARENPVLMDVRFLQLNSLFLRHISFFRPHFSSALHRSPSELRNVYDLQKIATCDLIQVHITRFAETLCEVELRCDRERVMAEYNITGSADARENLYKYKYVVGVDGTTFSGWFLGLLRSGSLVFKYFNDWLRPFEHFVSVLPDLSDLVQKIEWANANPAEARLIQRRGSFFTSTTAPQHIPDAVCLRLPYSASMPASARVDAAHNHRLRPRDSRRVWARREGVFPEHAASVRFHTGPRVVLVSKSRRRHVADVEVTRRNAPRATQLPPLSIRHSAHAPKADDAMGLGRIVWHGADGNCDGGVQSWPSSSTSFS